VTQPRPAQARALLKAALIVAVGGWIYWPALHGGWVWDDLMEIPQNVVLRDPHGLARIWEGSGSPDYFPLKTSLQWLLGRIWGEDPVVFHAVSLGLHLLSALLFWRLLQMLGLRFAWLGGLFLVVHPLVVESVAWIAELKNTLSLALLLAASIAYVSFSGTGTADIPRQSPTGDGEPCSGYWLSLAFFLLALLSKSSVVMFPFVILLHCWWRQGRIGRKDLRNAAPFFGLSLLLGLVTIFFQYHRALSAWTVPVGGFASRMAVAGTSLSFYLWKSLVPAGLHPMYRQWSVEPPSLAQFLPWLVLFILLGWLWTERAAWGRHVILGLGFFVLNLLPVLGFVPMSYMHISWVADHFVYLPLLGLIGLGVAAVGAIWQRLPSGIFGLRLALAGGIGLLALLLARESRGDAESFRSDDALWSHTLRLDPQAWMARIDLGRDLFQAGLLEEAIDQYNQALGIRSDLPEAYYNRGSILLRLGRLPEAIRDMEEALRLQPDSPDAQTNLGNALARAGRLPDAIPHYEAALRLQPGARDARANLAEAHYEEANALAGRRQFVEAIGEYQKALAVRPDFVAAHANLGTALFVVRRLPEAIAQFEEVLRLDPSDARTRANLNLARRTQRAAAP